MPKSSSTSTAGGLSRSIILAYEPSARATYRSCSRRGTRRHSAVWPSRHAWCASAQATQNLPTPVGAVMYAHHPGRVVLPHFFPTSARSAVMVPTHRYLLIRMHPVTAPFAVLERLLNRRLQRGPVLRPA